MVVHLQETLSRGSAPDQCYGTPVEQFPLDTGTGWRSLEQTPASVDVAPPCGTNYSASPH